MIKVKIQKIIITKKINDKNEKKINNDKKVKKNIDNKGN